MQSDLKITQVERSRRPEVDFDALEFGNVFSDHMFSMRFEQGQWRQPEILPYGPIAVDPANAALHYGQAVFEGLKVFRGGDGQVRVFRADVNAARLRDSCERLCIPAIEETVFQRAIDELVKLDHAWIPHKRGQALYIRPLVFSDEGHLDVRPSRRFRFIVMTSPVRAYFDARVAAVSLKVEQTHTRSAPGGTGYAKTAGNYGASLYPGEQGRQEGFAQVLWLDGIEHRYVEEVGQMNIFFKLKDTVVTPDLRGTILPGVTRDSVLTLLRGRGIEVEERRIAIAEIVEAIKKGDLIEAFGSGTAAIVAPVGSIAYEGELFTIQDASAGALTRALYDELTGIQLGEIPDRHGWTRAIPLETKLDSLQMAQG